MKRILTIYFLIVGWLMMLPAQAGGQCYCMLCSVSDCEGGSNTIDFTIYSIPSNEKFSGTYKGITCEEAFNNVNQWLNPTCPPEECRQYASFTGETFKGENNCTLECDNSCHGTTFCSWDQSGSQDPKARCTF